MLHIGSLLISIIAVQSDYGEIISGRCKNRKIQFLIKCTHIKELCDFNEYPERYFAIAFTIPCPTHVRSPSNPPLLFSDTLDIRLPSILPPNMPRQIETRTIERTYRQR